MDSDEVLNQVRALVGPRAMFERGEYVIVQHKETNVVIRAIVLAELLDGNVMVMPLSSGYPLITFVESTAIVGPEFYAITPPPLSKREVVIKLKNGQKVRGFYSAGAWYKFTTALKNITDSIELKREDIESWRETE